MGEKLASPAGKARYAQRKWLSEAPNGWIKEVLGFRRFSLRGLAKVRGEWDLVCLALNIKRMGTVTASDVAQVLRDAPQTIRSGALEVLVGWLRDDEAGVEETWRLRIKPFFENVWPKERKFRDVSLTHHLIDLAVGTGNEFPAVLVLLHPYIVPFDQGRGSLRSIVSSEAPEKFPCQTLSLLWLVCGPSSRGSFYEISKIIDRLIASDPDIEADRRLQWLEHRAERYD